MFQSKQIPDISANKLFSDTVFADLNLSLSLKDFKKMKEGEIIFEAGDKSDALFLIVEGKVKVKMPSKEETSIVVIKNKNDFFGEKELITKSDRKSSAVALENIILYKMKLDQLNKLISVNQKVRQNLTASSMTDEFERELNSDEEDFSDISDIDINRVENYTNEYFEAEQIRAEVEKDFDQDEDFNDDSSFEENEKVEDEFIEEKINLKDENLMHDETEIEENQNSNANEFNKLETKEEIPEEKMKVENIKTDEPLGSNSSFSSAKEIIKFLNGNIKSSNEIINKCLSILSKKKLPDDVKLILKEISYQNNLTQNYLNTFSDFSENKNNLKPDKVSINQSLNEILERLAEYSELRKVELFKKLGDDASVNLDKNNFYQACYQIIKNSCDAANSDGKIYVTSTKNDNEIIIEFKDNGIGIPESIKEDIFEPFVSQGKDGAGLGLAISKKIINDHGGNVKAESILGEGAAIIISLPVAK